MSDIPEVNPRASLHQPIEQPRLERLEGRMSAEKNCAFVAPDAFPLRVWQSNA